MDNRRGGGGFCEIMAENPFIPFGGFETQARDLSAAGIAVLPLCYENAPSYGTGSAAGPYHVLEASVQLERMDEEALVDWADPGIYTLLPPPLPADPQSAVQAMKAAAEGVLIRKKRLLSLGGDHAISIGPIMAAREICPDIGVLQVDAHLDLRDTWNGSRYNHACVMRRVVTDLNLPVVQVGIRSFSPEEHAFVRQQGLAPIYAHDIAPGGVGWIDAAVDRLPENVYLTVDLDGLDPSVVPGTGTPEPGGCSTGSWPT